MSVVFENTGLRIFHVLTETTLAGINVSDPDTKNIARISFFGLVEPIFFSFASRQFELLKGISKLLMTSLLRSPSSQDLQQLSLSFFLLLLLHPKFARFATILLISLPSPSLSPRKSQDLQQFSFSFFLLLLLLFSPPTSYPQFLRHERTGAGGEQRGK